MTSRDPAVPARRDPSAPAPGPRLRLVGGGGEPAAAPADRSAGEKTQELFERHHRRLVGFLRRLTSAEQAEEKVAKKKKVDPAEAKRLEQHAETLRKMTLFRQGRLAGVQKREKKEKERRGLLEKKKKKLEMSA